MSKKKKTDELPVTPAMASLNVTWKDCYRTPPEILDLVRMVGPIGLDPCTAVDNPTGARVGYTIESPAPTDGAKWSLGGTSPGDVTYCNWPYSANGVWVDRLLAHAAIAVPLGYHVIGLANASVGTEWFDKITSAAQATCFVTNRLAFLAGLPPHPRQPGNQWGTGIWYLGNEPEKFADIFSSIGHVMQRYRSISATQAQAALLAAADRLNVDEFAVLTRLAQRLELGRTRYASLNLATDKRDWSKEMHEELLDMMVYAAARELTK